MEMTGELGRRGPAGRRGNRLPVVSSALRGCKERAGSVRNFAKVLKNRREKEGEFGEQPNSSAATVEVPPERKKMAQLWTPQELGEV